MGRDVESCESPTGRCLETASRRDIGLGLKRCRREDYHVSFAVQVYSD